MKSQKSYPSHGSTAVVTNRPEQSEPPDEQVLPGLISENQYPGQDAKLTDSYRRRAFLRHGFALAGITFAWNSLKGLAYGKGAQAQAQEPKTAEEVLAELKTGNQRYATGTHLHHDYGPERAELALSQHPFAIVLSCADSRVSPELTFDQSRGRLFVIRLAGNFVDDNGLASAEYGAAVLGASLIVVLGHSECGAIKATIDVLTKNKELPGHLPTLVSYLKPPVEQALKQGGSLEAAIRQNVATNVEKLRTAGPVIAPLVEEKKVEVVGALYELRTGRVEFLS
jgi:carbonic anhydrase